MLSPDAVTPGSVVKVAGADPLADASDPPLDAIDAVPQQPADRAELVLQQRARRQALLLMAASASFMIALIVGLWLAFH
jgi:hypothetical protein